MSTAAARRLTAEEFARLPNPVDGSKQELVRGEVGGLPAFGFHRGLLRGTIAFRLNTVVKRIGSGRVTMGVGVVTGTGPDTVRGPDVSYWSYDRLPREEVVRGYPTAAPDLVAEVVSPGNTPERMTRKVREYFQSGVRLVWVVHPEERTVTVYTKPGDGTVRWEDATLTGGTYSRGSAVRWLSSSRTDAMKPSSAARVTRSPVSASQAVFLLENGARMDQPTFHALYKLTPEGFRAQLIGGTVYVMASPTSLRHGRPHARVVHWLCLYMGETPGTDVLDNTTSILGPESEPEPDASLLIQPEYGGQTKLDEDHMVVGASELVVEVANSSLAIDLGRKKLDYEQAGVKEYVVVTVEEQSLIWFGRGPGGFTELRADPTGVFRSVQFPGLWLDPRALFEPTLKRLTTLTRKGLASPEHAAFVADLAARRKTTPAPKKSRKSK